MRTVIGIDPDAEKFGYARYSDGELSTLANLAMPELVEKIFEAMNFSEVVVVSIENVMANQFVYARNTQSSKSAQSKVAMHIGRCQQSQVELQRWLEYYGIPYVLHKPQSGNWADKRELFERITGWKGQSNADNRAAAFFGFLALEKTITA
jgi:hypothetical protein